MRATAMLWAGGKTEPWETRVSEEKRRSHRIPRTAGRPRTTCSSLAAPLSRHAAVRRPGTPRVRLPLWRRRDHALLRQRRGGRMHEAVLGPALLRGATVRGGATLRLFRSRCGVTCSKKSPPRSTSAQRLQCTSTTRRNRFHFMDLHRSHNMWPSIWCRTVGAL